MLDSASNKDKAKVGRVKRTLCVKWTFTCEQVCQYAFLGLEHQLPGFFNNNNRVEQISVRSPLIVY